MTNIAALKARNDQRWAAASLTRAAEFKPVAKRLVAAKSRYQAVSGVSGVPWFVIAVIHQRESSQNWSKSLAQGDPWNKKSTHVPKGRGPFTSWEAAAIDALVICPPYAAKWKDWSPGGTLTLLEQYNGLGYFKKDIPSPYVWSGTDQYIKGKYVADGVFHPNHVDKQLGCAGLILAMKDIDPSISFDGSVPHGEQSSDIYSVQKRLDALGYHEVGTVDGKWGGKTAAAIAAFKNDRHLDGEPVIDDALLAALEDAEQSGFKRAIAPSRAEATEATVAKEAPEIVPVKRGRFAALLASIVTGALAVINAVADYFQDALSWVMALKQHAAGAPAWLWFAIAFGVALLIWFAAKNGANGIVEAFRKGERA